MKKITKMLVLLTMVICLSGCMKIKVEMDVKSSTELTMNMDYMFLEESLTTLGITKDQMIEQMKKGMSSSKDYKMTPKNETIDGKSWVGLNINGPIDEKQIKDILTEKEIDGKKCIVLKLSKSTMSGSQFGGINPDSITQQSGASVEELKASGMEMNIVINMPAKATTNLGKADGNKVTIDLLELASKGSDAQDIEISSPLSSGFDMTYILIGVGVVVLIGIVVFMLKKKKTSKNIETVGLDESTESQLPVEETETKVIEEPVQDDTTEVLSTTSDTTDSCPNCGEKIDANDSFCQKCGFDLKK